jgi:hypothetical protein
MGNDQQGMSYGHSRGTANPDDFKGAEAFVEVIGVRARPNNL